MFYRTLAVVVLATCAAGLASASTVRMEGSKERIVERKVEAPVEGGIAWNLERPRGDAVRENTLIESEGEINVPEIIGKDESPSDPGDSTPVPAPLPASALLLIGALGLLGAGGRVLRRKG